MSFLLPLLISSPSLGTTSILDMAPPLKMHDSCRAEALIDVSDETLSAMDSNPFAGSNSQLLFPTIGTQFDVHAEAILDSNLKYKSSPQINVALPDSPPNSHNDRRGIMEKFVQWLNFVFMLDFMHDFFDISAFVDATHFDWSSIWPNDGYLAYAALLAHVLRSLCKLDFPWLVWALMYVACILPYAGTLYFVFDGALATCGLLITAVGLYPRDVVKCDARVKPIFVSKNRSQSACSSLHKIAKHGSHMIIKLMLVLIYLSYMPIAGAVGLETPKINIHDYFLPGVSKWDGMPFHDFRRVWWLALCAALGNISQDGWSLLQTARDQDLGAPGNPGTPGQAVQSANRNLRLFGAILNYIEATSFLYRTLSRAPFMNDGRAIFNYLWVYGYLPYTPDEIKRLQNEWIAATMSSVNIKYTPIAIFKWADYVNTLGDKLGKTHQEKRTKYLEGFPASFDIMIVNERKLGNPGSHVFPANYPAHHPNAGAVHPDAGEPDIDEMARVFYVEWARMINHGQIKPIPHGMHGHHVRQVDDMNDSPFEPTDDQTEDAMRADIRENELDASNRIHSVNMTRAAVNQRTVCATCGGIGHASKVDGYGVCMTSRLGHRVPHEHLSSMKYPDGYTPFRFLNARDNTPGSPRQTRSHRTLRNSPAASPRASNSNPRFARAVECELDTERVETDPNNSLASTSLQIAAEALRLSRASSFKPRPRPKLNSRGPQPRRARVAEEVQTEDENDDEEGDEHEGLRVSFENVRT